ncbi:MAG: hypothetical protein M1839_000738 [Geoglossum umbratile]|nr:MAG: hypothetical protein M1839_000738 [Geoglossum umbratile]
MALSQTREVVAHAASRAMGLLSVLGPSWRVICILFLFANLKSLPLVWHLRFLHGLLSHFYLHRNQLTLKSGPRAVFQPLITSSRPTLLECDYNNHKSNSTYFSDLDISRTNLVAALLKGGYRERKSKGKVGNGGLAVMLGAVSCVFKKEIAPYEGYEIWNRVLGWDRKWLFIVSHFVKKGAVRPKGYTLQPGRDPKKSRAWWLWGGRDVATSGAAEGSKESSGTSSPSEQQQQQQQQRPPHKAIFASAISKYVFKQGRITVSPELVFERSGFLPPRPSSPLDESAIDLAASKDLPSKGETVIEESLVPELGGEGEWDWARMERERRRGMLLAEKLLALDGLHAEFTGEEEMALGEY